MSPGTESWDAAERRGAARERRRIRAKQRALISELSEYAGEVADQWVHSIAVQIAVQLDAATRSAPRKGRGR